MKKRFNEFEIETLAAHLVGLEDVLNDEDDSGLETIENEFQDRFNITIEQFSEIANALAKHTLPSIGNAYQGFVAVKEGRFIAKIDYKREEK